MTKLREDPTSPPVTSSPEALAEPGRRQLIDHALVISSLALTGAAAYPVLRYLTPQPGGGSEVGMLSIGPVEQFAPGTSRVVRLGDDPVIVVRHTDGKFHALRALCTHLGCVVSYQANTGLIHCACHQGIFALTGQTISGPPPQPLRTYTVQLVGNEIVLKAS